MVNLIRQLVNALRAAWRRQADLEELSALGDYQLADLGIRREQIFLRGKKRPEGAKEQPLPKLKPRPEFAPCG